MISTGLGHDLPALIAGSLNFELLESTMAGNVGVELALNEKVQLLTALA